MSVCNEYDLRLAVHVAWFNMLVLCVQLWLIVGGSKTDAGSIVRSGKRERPMII